MKNLRILGIRGVPAAHGGFETFAEHLSIYLQKKGWRIIVYCQENGTGKIYEDVWQGIVRIHIPVSGTGPKGTVIFDWKSTVHASKHKDLCLTLGYNTALFGILLKIKKIPNIFNMDGIEWSRMKWGPFAKLWFWLNDWVGCWVGNHLVADHPEIKLHLSTRVNEKKITIIPYGADFVRLNDAKSIEYLSQINLKSKKYWTVIARPEPENSLLEIVQGFSTKLRGMNLVVLGNYHESNDYHCAVKKAASSEVLFIGAIYDKKIVQTLRFFSLGYVHGHQVGGTNPSLVEALGAGNAVLAHDNRFNRWVAGNSALYFKSADDLSKFFDELDHNKEKLENLQKEALKRFNLEFTWETVLSQYEELLLKHLPNQ
jgi:glycosyltransferase involved in cell wall biosynthesis